ncbi:MAG: RlmE family RNA methyltransferase [Alphaproteobacteria bacterium]|nr:RlmE family RNA methyltransferase [Alphaproteobacteria bacterium]
MSRNKAKSKVKTAKGRKISSTRWLKRQLNDPYVEEAKKQGYRSRAAFKLKELDDKLALLKSGMSVVDLGAAPGGWSQVAAQKGCTKIVAIDLLEIDEISGVDFIQMDFMDNEAPNTLKEMLGGQADIVLSDIAPNTTGHKQTDHLRIMAVVEAAHLFATEVLKPGGTFIAKVFQGGAQNELVAQIKKDFASVKHIKPAASRKESSETYLVATGFRG